MTSKEKVSRPPPPKPSINLVVGKIGEQIELENKSRSKYKQRWGEVIVSDFYSSNRVNERVREVFEIEKRPVSPFQYRNQGESYFLSPEMYEAYMVKCRCGQKKSGVHLVNCLKKCSQSSLDKDKEITQIKLPPLPLKSSEMIGLKHNYLTWERSTFYVSPKCYVPKQAKVGYRLFNHIILG
uniref:CSON012014 protein n=1 Tax=Culicoides sonorensis TaxID=179676 RepID=A0A336K2I0_CULSO